MFCDWWVVFVGLCNFDYLFKDNELLRLFAGFIVWVYWDEDCIGRIACGWCNKVMIVVQRPYR